MSTVSVLVLLLVCAFTAAKDLKITCDDVTGHVGKELNLTCSLSYQNDTCNMKIYKFMNKDKDTTICREEFKSDPCLQFFTCSYTANEVMTTTFKFFIQTTQGSKSAEFTVNIAEARKGEETVAETVSTEDTAVKTDNTLPLAVAILAICLVIMVAVGFILQRKYNCFNILQREYNLGECEENNITELKHTEV